ncbi:RNA-guided endonuclease InsQ/TnpB family protein [Neobacillus massiliamazoniensis]|uniref:Transposase, IS605 family protein n=1 Tax=Neobacillus massiliamazoniensis TaxID=1499688 RepID=A0A0U1NYZ1_9BACI|nr:RNA-guided endonuclease TnpB family protein [Neobacillus massiliamazoniensis]CRK83226.1 transposase, IS605 family protein [Neobacillus massiliamazoniensis]
MSKQYGIQKEKLHLNKKEYLALRQLCWLSKNMFNVGLYQVRQHFFETKQYLCYEENYKIAKQNENYKLLGSAASQQTLKKVEEAFKSFFSLIKIEGQKARIPRYLKKDGFFEISYPQFKLQADGSFNVPMSPKFKKEFGLINIKFPSNLNSNDICEIRILPKYNASYFEIEYVYEVKTIKPKLNHKHALSIDLGINNLATCVTTLGTSFIIDGRKLKSVNQRYNQQNARLQSIKDKQGIKTLTNRQIRLLEKRRNFVRDYLNKTTRYIINYCLDHNIGKIVIGYNQGWKQNINLGKQSNQKFVQIPHSQLIDKIESMCKRYGIELVKQEESYTSKASFIDKDHLPAYNEKEDKIHLFSGKRIKRGLYQTKASIKINADVNGAANILRKSNHEFHLEEVAKGILTFPTRIRLISTGKQNHIVVSSKNHVSLAV